MQAKASYVEARRIYDLIDDPSGIANTTWGLGEIYRLLDDSAKAEVSYMEAWKIYAHINDWRGVVDSEWGLGEVHRRRGEYSKARSSYPKAQEISTRIGYEWGLTSALFSQAKVEPCITLQKQPC